MLRTYSNQSQLADHRCEDPDCSDPDHQQTLYLDAACHRGIPFRVIYEKDTGQFVVLCCQCYQEVARIQLPK